MSPLGRLTEGSGRTGRGGLRALLAPSESALLKRVALGDCEAFKALYVGYRRRLFCYFVKMLGDRGRAEELVNDVLVEVWKGARTYEGRSAPSTWILGIAHHKALDELRKRKAEPLEPDVLAAVPDPAEGAAEAVARGDLATAMKDALARLSSEHREVLELTYYQGLSIQAIAAIVQCPANTVKTRMFYARRKLKEILFAMGVAQET